MAVHYPNEKDNEYDRLLEFWTNVEALRKYGKENDLNNEALDEFIEKVNNNAEYIEDWLDNIEENRGSLDSFFEPLSQSERRKDTYFYTQAVQVLTQQKAKRFVLRIYAIRIDVNTYLITGGAIKWSQKMQDHPDTKRELEKLQHVLNFITQQGVFDTESLIDLQNELQ